METQRLFVAIILLILLLSPDNTANGPGRDYELNEIVAEEKRWLGVLQNSTYGNVGNLTGFIETGWWSPNGMGIVRNIVSDMSSDVFKRTTLDEGTLVSVPTVMDDTAVKRATDEELNNDKAPSDTKKMGKERLSDLDQHVSSLSEAPIYHNVSGILRGDWQKLHIPNLHKSIINGSYERNITKERGHFWMSIKEREVLPHWKEVEGAAQAVILNMDLTNERGGDETNVRMRGVHFVETGLIVGVSSSDKFAGIFGLPHLTPSNTTYELVKKPLNTSISNFIKDHEEAGDEYPPWIPPDDQFLGIPPIRCEFIVYVQVHPIKLHPTVSPFQTASQQVVIDVTERELRFKSGEYLPIPPPPLVGSAIIYSPDCSFVLSTNSATGLKIESYYHRICNFALTACFVVAIEIYLIIRQMNESSTPSTLSRVSFWTIGIISLLDGYIVIIFIIASSLVERCSLPLIAASFFCAVFAGFFGMRYMLMIYRVQLPERRAAQERAQQANPQPTPAAAAAQAAANRAAAEGTLPLPVTAPTPNPAPTPATTNSTTRQDFSAIITRFYMFLVITGFLMIYSISLPILIRTFIHRVALFSALSFWIPQIYRNTYRNCRKGLKWEFVFGISACRLVAVLYFYGYSENILFTRPEKYVCYAAIGWVWCQIWLLGVQELLGPRFLIPDGILPPAYDYHPILPLDDLERALPHQNSPTSPTASHDHGGSGRSQTHKSFDCAICMQSVEIPVTPSDARSSNAMQGGAGGAGVGGILGQNVFVGRRNYMVTPCRHVFHSGCLEGWMRVRLQCPICRNALPPI